MSVTGKNVKCLVWDLDRTLWDGVLSEGDDVRPFRDTAEIIRKLDERGILQSIASKNDAKPALARLASFGLQEYFLHPQINWGPKSASLKRIAEKLNIATDAIAFMDDEPFELGEVASVHPGMLCISAGSRAKIVEMDEFHPPFVTDEARGRRQMYISDSLRQTAQESFEGPQEEFLSSLSMRFTLKRAEHSDLQRLEELVARTNQLNTTGRIYSLRELDDFRVSETHDLWAAALSDIYGEYGTIGLALISKEPDAWTIKAFLMSCRVMSRGVGSVFIQWLQNEARGNGVSLRSEIIPNDRNRIMIATYRFAGFREIGKMDGVDIFEHPLTDAAVFPAYVEVVAK